MKFYNVTLRCPEKKLTTLMGVVSGEMTLVKVEPEGGGTIKPRVKEYVGGVRNKGISGEALALETLAKKPHTRQELQAVFVKRGFAETSSAGVTSVLRAAGKIEQVNGKWSLAKKK